MNDWQPVRTAPVEALVLVRSGDPLERAFVGKYTHERGWVRRSGRRFFAVDVPHGWKPLPKSPDNQ